MPSGGCPKHTSWFVLPWSACLFFGVAHHQELCPENLQGKFYELYEVDAEIGQKEMDWKLTLSGVGKCRQVRIVAWISLLDLL